MIKNIIFDMGNVLLNYNPRAYLAELLPPETAQIVADELFGGLEWQMLDGGSITEEGMVQRVCARIPQCAESVKLAVAGWDRHMTPIEGSWDIARRLKARGHKLFLLSNASMRFFEYSKRYEIFSLFDGIVISAQEKLLKPDPAIYRLLLERYSLEPRECLFIDDVHANVQGAQTVGMATARFTGVQRLEVNLTRQGVL